VTFNRGHLADLANDIGRMLLTKYNLQGGGTPANISLYGSGQMTADDNVLSIDFGASGIYGAANSTTGDGYYKLSFDLDSSGSVETYKYFYRLLGNVTSDRTVTGTGAGTDWYLVNSHIGESGALNNWDVDGDGDVDATDTSLVYSCIGHYLAAGLTLDD